MRKHIKGKNSDSKHGLRLSSGIDDILKALHEMNKNAVLSDEQILKNKKWEEIDKVLIPEAKKHSKMNRDNCKNY